MALFPYFKSIIEGGGGSFFAIPRHCVLSPAAHSRNAGNRIAHATAVTVQILQSRCHLA